MNIRSELRFLNCQTIEPQFFFDTGALLFPARYVVPLHYLYILHLLWPTSLSRIILKKNKAIEKTANKWNAKSSIRISPRISVSGPVNLLENLQVEQAAEKGDYIVGEG